MKHKEIITSNSRDEIISFLKKQRDGLIIGSYRSILADLYDRILLCCKQNNGVCLISDLIKLSDQKNKHIENVTIDFCLDLEQLGYITIDNNNTIEIKHRLDF